MTDQAYARISITLPPSILAEADRLARELDRPRSWVIAEAIRSFGRSEWPSARGPTRDQPAVREVRAAPYPVRESGLGEQRLAQLCADLALSAEERVRAAEETASLDRVVGARSIDQILGFSRYEDYLDWDQRTRIRR